MSHLRSFFTYGDLLSGVYTPACAISSLRDFALVKFQWITKSTSSLCLFISFFWDFV